MFPETILQMNNGATVMELSNALEKVVAAVRAAGKSGSIKLIVKVSPASKGSADALRVESQVKTKLPLPGPDRGMTVFYVTEDNHLVRNNPKQQILPLRVVDIDQRPNNSECGVNAIDGNVCPHRVIEDALKEIHGRGGKETVLPILAGVAK